MHDSLPWATIGIVTIVVPLAATLGAVAVAGRDRRQFEQRSWEWVGGTGSPHEASKQEQIRRAEVLLERQGWEAWPACSRQLGLR